MRGAEHGLMHVWADAATRLGVREGLGARRGATSAPRAERDVTHAMLRSLGRLEGSAAGHGSAYLVAWPPDM